MWNKIPLIHTYTYLKVDNMPTIGFEIKRKCKVCGKVFVAKTLDSYYCSRRCSNVAWKRKRDEKLKNARLEAIAQLVPDIREYMAINIGERLTRIKRSDMERLFLSRPESAVEKEKPIPKLYSMEPEDCYTITEVCEKYHINDSSVWAHVRKYSIPSRQIGNYVYVPKQEIDNLYKSEIE